MKNDFVIKEKSIGHFELMIKDIKEFGRSDKCPVWSSSFDKVLTNTIEDV